MSRAPIAMRWPKLARAEFSEIYGRYAYTSFPQLAGNGCDGCRCVCFRLLSRDDGECGRERNPAGNGSEGGNDAVSSKSLNVLDDSSSGVSDSIQEQVSK